MLRHSNIGHGSTQPGQVFEISVAVETSIIAGNARNMGLRFGPAPAVNAAAMRPMHTRESATGSGLDSMPRDAGDGSSGGASTTMSAAGMRGTAAPMAWVISSLPGATTVISTDINDKSLVDSRMPGRSDLAMFPAIRNEGFAVACNRYRAATRLRALGFRCCRSHLARRNSCRGAGSVDR